MVSGEYDKMMHCVNLLVELPDEDFLKVLKLTYYKNGDFRRWLKIKNYLDSEIMATSIC